jgi:hypothetical protein
LASWRSGYAEDCKSLHPGSIPGEASNKINDLLSKTSAGKKPRQWFVSKARPARKRSWRPTWN